MISERIDLYEYFKIDRKEAKGGFLLTYIRTPSVEINPKLRPAMLVIPGGAYMYVSDREAEPIALRFLAEGFSSFVLTYSTQTAYPVPLIEACMAVIYIRKNATKYSVDSEHIAAIGFSAGGHLTGLLATINKEREITDILGDKIEHARLNAVVLSYPVITMGKYTHVLTRNNITGGNSDLIERLSIEKRVTKNIAPAFIWHTNDDGDVPVENSLLLANSYRKVGAPYSLHLFERGRHGLSLCCAETNNQTEEDLAHEYIGKWVELVIDWLNSHGFKVKMKV